MSADPQVKPMCPPTSGLGQALYFESGSHRLFGWLHRPADLSHADVGLVICNPFGYELVCAHRSVRALAEMGSALGMPALRFDYLGTGDSADIDPEADQLETWRRDILAAAAELQRLTGVKSVCLIGIRFGALLATLAAAQCKAVDRLILIAPIVSGRRYLKELRTARLVAATRKESVDSLKTDTVERPVEISQSMEAAGFTLSAATVAALGQVDLTTLSVRPAAEMLIIDNDRFPVAAQWCDVLSKLGVATQRAEIDGLVSLLMSAPQFQAVPQTMVEAVRSWLARLPREAARSDRATRIDHSPLLAVPTDILSLYPDGVSRQAMVTERPVFLPTEVMLFGIISEPRQGESRRRGVILLNAAADYHIGAGRMYVSLARHWAARGYFVLRLDLAGMGDSATRSGRLHDEVFPREALDDIAAAIDFLRNRYAIVDITLAGLCSGAFHALRAAKAALPVNRLLMVNPLQFFGTEGADPGGLQLAEVVARPAVYRNRLFSFRAWRKLLTGKESLWKIVMIYGRRVLLAVESSCRDIARWLHIPLPQDLGRELENLAMRGVRMVFVFARGEPGIELLKLQAGSSVSRLGDSCRIHVIDSGDHIFGAKGARELLESILSYELSSPVGRAQARRAQSITK